MIRLNKSTRSALYAVMEMTLAGSEKAVTVGETAARYGISEGALAKVFQQLVKAGMATATRGVGGGYRLTRRPAEVTVLEILNIFEPVRTPGDCLLDDGASGHCRAYPGCRLGRLFDEVDELARNTFASITLETLVK